MDDVKKKQANKAQLWDFGLFILNSDIIYQGLKTLTENYLNNDRLPLSYFFLIGAVGAILGAVISRILRKRSLRMKITFAGLLLVVVVITCVWVLRSVD